MYSDVFDSVRTQISLQGETESLNNSIYSEVSLFQSLLTGHCPNLTPAQILDSSSFFNITSTNRDVFLKLMNNEFITITLFPGEKSLRHHFLKCLNIGINEESDLYNFSIFPFLNNYEKKLRIELQKKMISSIENQYTDFHMDGIDASHSEYLEEVFNNFQIIDVLTAKNLKSRKKFTQNISPLVQKMCIELIEKKESEEFKILYDELLNDNNGETAKTYYRSIYYGFIDRIKSHYSEKVISLFRNIVDICYNIAIASAIDDKEGTKISSKLDYFHTSNTLQDLNPQEKQISSLTVVNKKKNILTWDIVYEILTEVKSLSIEKKISYKTALLKYKQRNSMSDTFSVCKYVLYSGLKTLIPCGDFINVALNMATDLSLNAGTEFLDDKLKQLSITDLISKIHNNHKKKKIVNSAIDSIKYNESIFGEL